MARRVRLPGHRRRAGEGPVLRPDGAQGRGRARPRRRPHLPEPGVPRRHARRARLDQRDLRGRHQDQLRAVPALLDLHRWRAQERPEREGAHLQRQGRRPAVPRPRQPQAGQRGRCRPAGRLRDAGARGRSVRVGRVLRPADARRPHRPPARHRSYQRGERVLVDAGGVLLRRAAALRLRRRGGRAQPVHDGHPPGRGPAAAGGGRHRARRGGDGRGTPAAHVRRPDRVPLRPADRRGRPPRLGGPGHRHGHGQRVPAPAALQPQAGALDRPRRPGRRRAAGW